MHDGERLFEDPRRRNRGRHVAARHERLAESELLRLGLMNRHVMHELVNDDVDRSLRRRPMLDRVALEEQQSLRWLAVVLSTGGHHT